jgi:RNA polymerase sigma-70 factor (ECF subfamily)
MIGMDVAQRTDEELAALAGGETSERDAALSALLGRHARRLHRFFAMQFRDEELTRDLVQEVFERVIGARERLPRDSGFSPWIWTIAVNLARNTRRKRRNAPTTLSLDVPPEIEDAPLHERLADAAPSPRHRAERSEQAARLLRAVEQIEAPQREVILLKYFQNLPCSEVARVLEISEGTVWSRTHRALVRLKEILTASDGEM